MPSFAEGQMERLRVSSSVHAYSMSEKSAFVRYINSKLEHDIDLMGLLPLDPASDSIFDAVKDGVLLAKLLHASVPDSIDLDRLKVDFVDAKAKPFRVLENHRLVLEGARKIGCTIVNISGEDLRDGKPYLVFGVVWQIIRCGLLFHVNLSEHPELTNLYGANEDIRNIPAEALLLRWFNWHIGKSGLAIKNFGADLADSKAYAHLLHALKPDVLPSSEVARVCSIDSLLARAESILSLSKTVNTASQVFLCAEDILAGREKLNLCFVASLFNAFTGMAPIHEELESKIGNLETLLARERAGTGDLSSVIEALRERVRQLESENAMLKQQLKKGDDGALAAVSEKLALETKFTKAVNQWQDIQKSYENEIGTLENLNDQLSRDLKKSQDDLTNERRQVETFGICADSLADELEGFRSRQEKMEYLIEHLKMERSRSDLHSARLRALYKSFASTEQLCKAIYAGDGDNSKNLTLYLEKVATDATKVGTLTKKARDNNNWRVRYFVLRDNFLFYYKNEGELRAEPKGVVRLDDCTVRYSENPTNVDLKGLAILCIEIPNHGHLKDVRSDMKSGRLSFFLAGSILELTEWKDAIVAASAWWTRKSSVAKMQSTMCRNALGSERRTIIR